MSVITTIRRMLAPLLILNIVQRYKGKSALMRIKAAQAYIVGVRKLRIVFLGIILMVFSFVLLGSGLSLFHTALFEYSLWSSHTKFIAGLVLGAAEFVAALGVLSYLSREAVWVKFAEIPKVLNLIVSEKK